MKGYFLCIFQQAPGLKCLSVAVAVSVAALVTVTVAICLIGFRASIVTS